MGIHTIYIYATVDQSFLRIQCWLCPCFVSTKNIRKQFTLLLFLRNCNAWISEAMSLLFLSQRQYSKVFRTSVDYDLGETCGSAETLMAHGILKTIALLSDPVSFCQFQCHIPCFELTWLSCCGSRVPWLRTLFHFVPERAALGTPTSRSWGWRKRHWCNRACSDPRPPQSPWSWFNIVLSHCLILSRPGWTPCSKIFRQSLHVHLPCSLECAHWSFSRSWQWLIPESFA